MSASYEQCRSEFSNKSRKFVSYIRKSSMKPHAQVTEVMRASNLLYVYACLHQTIHASRQVFVRVLRTAVRELACCDYTKALKTTLNSILDYTCATSNVNRSAFTRQIIELKRNESWLCHVCMYS